MAKYTKGMLVFGLGVLVVSMWCMQGTMANDNDSDDDDDAPIHTVKREEPEGCGTKHTEGGVEECSGEDDTLGLYADIDDTFKSAFKKVHSHFHHHHDDDDSPHVGNNNVDVMGH